MPQHSGGAVKFQITLNGKTYDVDVAEAASPGRLKVNVDGDAYEVDVAQLDAAPLAVAAAPSPAPVAVAAPPPPAPAPSPASAPAPAPAAAPTIPPAPKAVYDGQGTAVAAPMVGKILAVKVEPGAAVKQGALLFLLEAMKMENEITSPAAGTIASVAVEEGSSVKQGDLLCVIEP